MLKNKARARIKSIEIKAADFGCYIVTFARHNGPTKNGKGTVGYVCNQYGYNRMMTASQLSRVHRSQQSLIERINKAAK